MGEFSKLERQILVDISKLKYDKANAMELIGKSTLIEAALSWNVEENLFELFVPIDKKEWIGEFFETLCFIETLERDGLIYLHKNYEDILTKIDFQSYGLEQNYVNANMSKFGIQKVKTDLFERIKKFQGSFIIPTTRLKDLVKNDFKSYEQLRHAETLKTAQKQHDSEMRFTKIALVISIFALFIAIVVPNCTSTKIDKTQFDLLMEKIDNR